MDTIITIGRQCGSGGREIGRLLAESLGVPFYDRNSLKEAAIEMGLGKAMSEAYGDNASKLLYSLAMGSYSFGYHNASDSGLICQKASLAAFDAIKWAAKRGPCVIVGRCADYVLENDDRLMNVFIHAPLETRMRNVSARKHISETDAAAHVHETDRLRKNYYNYYTSKSWGDVNSYHLTLNSQIHGISGTAKLLRDLVMRRDALNSIALDLRGGA